MIVTSKYIKAPDIHRVQRALISVSDKENLVDFATRLVRHGVMLISTGGTAKAITQAGLPVSDVSQITNFPEIMNGRVKTLHPAIHGALLGVRDDPDHAAAMQKHGITGIDLVIVNLYPFEEICLSGANVDTIIENIDIGGPAMVRAAAKNHAYTAIVTDPADYEQVLAELDTHDGSLSFAFRRQLAARAYARTAAYDTAISNWFADTLGDRTPIWRAIAGKRHSVLRYGENPHQNAGFYRTGENRYGVATAKLVQGKQLSYNNINDADAAFELVAEFNPEKTAAVAIIKHANPCGVAKSSSLKEAYIQALTCDPISAFGGIVALNRILDAEVAEEIVKIFTEAIIAPDATPKAREIIAEKKNLRLLLTGGVPDPHTVGFRMHSVAGGMLVQSRDNSVFEEADLKVVTKRQPTAQELANMQFAFCVAKHVKSNAIVYAKNGATIGIGAGQMSRLDSARIAAQKARDATDAARLAQPLTKDCVVASDAFFPFADSFLSAIEAGATAVIQPGGSIRDEEVIAAADENNVAMILTGMRHFKH